MSGAPPVSDAALVRRILGNDLRLFWRSGSKRRKLGRLGGAAGTVLVLVVMHFVVYSMTLPFTLAEKSGSPVRGTPEIGCLIALSMVAMMAPQRTLEVLYNRGDLPLLLSSPVPVRIVLLTRLVDIVGTTLLMTMMIAVPIVDVAIWHGGSKWAWGYATWFATTMALAPLAMLMTIAFVERFGARRARTLLQVVSLLIGMGAFVMTQLPTWLSSRGRDGRPPGMRLDVFAWFEVPPLRQLAAAARGEWVWLVPLVLAAAALLALSHRLLGRRFAEGAQAAAADVGSGAARPQDATRAWRSVFRRGRTGVLMRTELLLVRRDPLLLMRCSMQIVSVVPMVFGVAMLNPLAGTAGGGIMAGALLPLTLSAMLNAGDEAFEFASAGPVGRRERAVVRAIGAATPALYLVGVVGLVLFAAGVPLLALLELVTGSAVAAASGWLGTCTTRRHTAEERARNRQPKMVWQALVVMLLGGIGLGGVTAIGAGYLLIGFIVLAVAWCAAGLLLLVPPQQTTMDS